MAKKADEKLLERALENGNVGNNPASENNYKEEVMSKQEVLASQNAGKHAGNTPASEEQTNTKLCCPKSKTTVIAVIDGKEQEITLARTIYSMDKLKKNQEKLLEEVDKNKLLDAIFHFATPDIFRKADIKLYDLEGEEIAEDAENVLVPVETSGTYWRFTFDDVLKHVQVHTFADVEEYAQVTGTTDLCSRSRNTVEKMGNAALATGDATYKAVYELARKTGMPGSTAMAYFGVQLKAEITLEMSMGLKRKDVPVLSRTPEEAFDLYQQISFTFTPAEAKKRYPPRAINSVMHAGGYDLDTIMLALKAIPSDEVHRALLADCGSKETCISNVLLKFIIEMQQRKVA